MKGFDVERYLQDRNIPYISSGKNISEGWVGLSCPFCGDRSTHLGWNLANANFFCWVCKRKGWAYELIEVFEDVSYEEAKKIGRNFFNDLLSVKKYERIPGKACILPKSATKEFPPSHYDYLVRRGFGYEEIQRYDLYACMFEPTWKYRITIPIYKNYQLVSFTARDITDEQDPKYKNCPIELSIIPAKKCVYNIDNTHKKIIVVEGPTDVWSIGTSTVCTLGETFTNAQVNALRKTGVEEATFIYDGEPQAIKLAEQFARNFSLLGILSYVIPLDLGKDPATLPPEDIAYIRKIVFST